MSEIVKSYTVAATRTAMLFLCYDNVYINLIELYRIALHPELAKGLADRLTVERSEDVIFVSVPHERKVDTCFMPIGAVELIKGGTIRARFTENG